jgi:hypothetical protein
MPQVLPVEHEAADPALKENELLPAILEAKVDIFFLTSELPHAGQATPSTVLALRTSSSKSRSQVLQTNSKSGMVHSSMLDSKIVIIDYRSY